MRNFRLKFSLRNSLTVSSTSRTSEKKYLDLFFKQLIVDFSNDFVIHMHLGIVYKLRWQDEVGRSKNPVSSQTDELMAGTKFSDYLGLKQYKKAKK